MLLLALASCHAAAPSPPPSSASESPPAPPQRAPSQDTARVAPRAEAHPSSSELPLQSQRDDPSGGPCEWSCADVHDCALLSGDYTPAAAASIEIGCVAACRHTPERATLFGCQRPPSLEPGTCSPFLDCVGTAWPDGRGPRPPADDAPVVDGCATGCEAFAHCYDASTTPDKIVRCAEMCRRALDQREQQIFGECARLPNCDDVINCVAATPGA